MKQYCALLILLLFAATSFAQTMPKPREVDKEYRKEYREAIREYEQAAKRLEDEEIQIPIEESVPVKITEAGILDFSNWTKPTVAPSNTIAKIVAAARYFVRYDVFDTGVDDAHPDLASVVDGKDNYTTEPNGIDGNGHGTHVTGITAGKTGGVVYELSLSGLLSTYSHKVLSSSGSGSFTVYAAALNGTLPDQKAWIDQGGFCVSNSSLGYSGAPLQYVETPLKQAYDYGGITHTAAAGNTGGKLGYPGSSAYTIAVGALDKDLQRASYSCFGDGLNVVSPGSLVNSTYLGGKYAVLSGTSMASPAGAAFFIAAYAVWGPKLKEPGKPLQYAKWIARKLTEKDWDEQYGFGLAMLDKIVDNDPDKMPADGDNPPPPPPPADPGKEYTLTWDTGGFVMRWRPMTATNYNLLHIPATRLQCTTTATSVENAWDACDNYVSTFYTNRAIIGVENVMDATWWSGRFLQIISAKTPTVITATELTGQDEQKKRLFVTTGFENTRPNFSSNAAPFLEQLKR